MEDFREPNEARERLMRFYLRKILLAVVWLIFWKDVIKGKQTV